MLAGAGTAFAQAHDEPIRTDRPDETESPTSIPVGVVQIETGWAMSQASDGTVKIREHAVPGVLLRTGIAPRLELRAGFGGWQSARLTGSVTESHTGVGDLEAGFKYEIFSSDRLQAAIMADVALPSGSAGFTDGQVSPVVRLSVSRSLSRRVDTGYNMGFAISGAEDGSGNRVTAAELIYTWTFGFELTEKLGLFTETFGTVGINGPGESRASLDAGLTFQLRPNLQLDAAGGVGLNRVAGDWFFGAGVSARLPR